MTVAIAAAAQNVYPPRVQVSVTGLTVGDALDVYRSVAGQRTLVRGGHVDELADTAFVIIDAELPFGVDVTYVAVVDGSTEYSTSATSYTLTGGKVALSDAITGQAAEVVILNIGDQTYGRDSARMRVAGRWVVVTGPAGQAEGSYDLYTETTSAHQNLLALLAAATESTVQIRQPGISAVSGEPYDGVDAYLAVDGWTVRRFSQDGSDPRRITTIQYAVTDSWAADLEARGFTYQEMVDAYSGQTYDDLAGDYATYLDLAQADFS